MTGTCICTYVKTYVLMYHMIKCIHVYLHIIMYMPKCINTCVYGY